MESNQNNAKEVKESLTSTQKNATDINERVKEIAFMSDKVNHDRMVSTILDDPKLSTAQKMKKFDHEQKRYQHRQKANARVNGKMQNTQAKNTVRSTIGIFVVFAVGGVVIMIIPGARTFVLNSLKQIGKSTAALAA